MIDEIIAKVKEEERKKILDDMHKRQVEKETIRYVFYYQFWYLLYTKNKNTYWICIGKKKYIFQYSFREFIEAQKIWVIKDRERVDKENREIARFIEDKDRWKVQVIIQSSKSVCCISCHIFCYLYFWLCKKWTYLIVYILIFQVAEDAKERRAIKVCIILMYSSKLLIRIQIPCAYV